MQFLLAVTDAFFAGGTIGNALRVALGIFSGKNILNFAFVAPLSAKARRCGRGYPFRHRLRRCHLPQGDGFRGGGKLSGTAQRRPLGGAGERSEPEGVGTLPFVFTLPIKIQPGSSAELPG